MKKQILILMGVGALTYGSANLALLDTNAALTAPTNWTFKYTNEDFPGYKLRNTNGVLGTPNYTRTADGVYWNYTTTYQITQGLNATQTFNRSNTTWYDAGSGNYVPSDTKIGSDATVGGVNKKWYVKIDNQTNKDYKLYLDFSSTNNINRIYHYYVNGEVFVANLTNDRLYYVDSAIFFDIWISAYSYVEFYTENGASNLNYLDAWYLQDLGESDAYTNGYDNGYNEGENDGYDAGYNDAYDEGFNEGIAAMPIGNIFQMAFATVATIFNIAVIGNLTLGSIIVAPIAIALLWFILGIVSGVGTGGKKK